MAAVCFNLPIPVVDVTAGRTRCEDLRLPPRPTETTDLLTRSVLKAYAVMFLAGRMAELRMHGHDLDAAEDNHLDVVRAREIVGWILPDNPPLLSGVMRGELTITTTDFLDIWDRSISAVVATALRNGSVSPDQTRDILAPAIGHSRRLAAYHEAGHAVMLWLEGDGQVPLSIGLGQTPAESSQNFTVLRRFSEQFYLAPLAVHPEDRELALRELQHVVAGEEMAGLIDASYPGAVRARDDRQKARELARKLDDAAGGQSPETIAARARASVRQRFQEPRPRSLVDALVAALLDKSPLGEDEIRHVLSAAEGAIQERR